MNLMRVEDFNEAEVNFSREILIDLINEGYEFDMDLIKELYYRKSQINNALYKMIGETRDYKVYKDVDDFFKMIE